MVVVSLLLLSGCAGARGPIKNEPARAPGEATLFERLGGTPAVTAIVDDWVERAGRDPRVNFVREGHPHQWEATADNVAQMKIYWTQFIGMLCDGPQIYEGRDMFTAHTGMQISEGEWLAMMLDLKQTLDAFRVPIDQQQDLMRRVAGTHDAIVNK
jgi:hemoglobin